jgi:hypothetical protein
MGEKWLDVAGWVYVLLGVFFVLASFSGLSGFVIFNGERDGDLICIGIIFFVCGIVLLFLKRHIGGWGEGEKEKVLRFARRDSAREVMEEGEADDAAARIEAEENPYWGRDSNGKKGDYAAKGPHGERLFYRYGKPRLHTS